MIRIDSHDCRPVPWLNGGGLTRELARGPGSAAQADFGWRLSLADLERDGPFSSMAGCDRSFALVDGAISLEFNAARVALDFRSDPVEFAGEIAPMAELRGDSICRAFNLILARGRWTGRMRRVRLADGQLLVADWEIANHGGSGDWAQSVRAASDAGSDVGSDAQPVHGCFVCRGRLMVQGTQVEAGEYLQFGPTDPMPSAIGTVSLLQILITPILPRPDTAPSNAG
jgi:environmental stress-induced protein Ves